MMSKMLLDKKNGDKLFLCTSADWQCAVEADSYDQAASKAVQEILEAKGVEFSIGAAVSVTELCLKKRSSILAFSPKILADIGMHTLSSNLLNIIDRETNDDN